MSEPQKKDTKLPKIISTQNMRPAPRKDTSDKNALDIDSTNSLRPPELNHPVVVPTPPKQYNKPVFLNEPTEEIPLGCFMFMGWMVLQFEVVNTGQQFRVSPIDGKTLIIGRNPETAPETIHIDLTPYVDNNDGVSRVHAAIRLEGNRLELIDKNSTNGTSLNALRFNPNEAYPIRSGDLVMLGQFQMIANFAMRLQSTNKHDTSILPPYNK